MLRSVEESLPRSAGGMVLSISATAEEMISWGSGANFFTGRGELSARSEKEPPSSWRSNSRPAWRAKLTQARSLSSAPGSAGIRPSIRPSMMRVPSILATVHPSPAQPDLCCMRLKIRNECGGAPVGEMIGPEERGASELAAGEPARRARVPEYWAAHKGDTLGHFRLEAPEPIWYRRPEPDRGHPAASWCIREGFRA